MNADYRAIRGRRTRLTPMLSIISGVQHEQALVRKQDIGPAEVIRCGNSVALPEGNRPDGKPYRYVYYDFTQAGETFVTEKCKKVLEAAAPNCAKFYPATMEFMETDEIFYIMKMLQSHIAVDYDASDFDEDEEFCTSLLLTDAFYKDVPEADRQLFELLDLDGALIAHKSVVAALKEAGICGFRSYELATWNSNPFKDPELIKLGDDYLTAEKVR